MRAVNQVTTYILALLLLVGGGLLVAAVVVFPGPYTVTAADGEQFSFTALTVLEKLLTSGVGVAIFLAGLFLLALELLGPPLRQQLPLATPGGAQASVARASVEERLAALLQRIPGVQKASVRVRPARGGLAVAMDLTADADLTLPPLCEQADALIAQTLKQDLGLHPGETRVRVRLAPRAAPGSARAAAS